MDNTQKQRRANLALLIDKWGGLTSLAKKLGHSGPSYLSQLVSGHRAISEKTARAIEEELKLSHGWMDGTPGPEAKDAEVDVQLLTEVVTSVGQILGEKGLKLSPAKAAELTVAVYEQAQQGGSVDKRFVERLVKLLT